MAACGFLRGLSRNFCAVVPLLSRTAPLSQGRPTTNPNVRRYFDSSSPSVSALKFTTHHEWVRVEEGIGTIGISNFAQYMLEDFTYCGLPDVGTQLTRRDMLGALESNKAVWEFYSPITGQVVEVNTLLKNNPGLVNSSCYKDGWLVKMTVAKPEELDKLKDKAAYERYIRSIGL